MLVVWDLNSQEDEPDYGGAKNSIIKMRVLLLFEGTLFKKNQLIG